MHEKALPSDLVRRLQAAVLTKDRETLEQLVDPGFALTGSAALGLLDKRQWIDSALEFAWEAFDFEESSTIDLESTAVVISRLRQRGRWKGRDISGRFLLVDVCRRLEGDWLLVSRYAERLPD